MLKQVGVWLAVIIIMSSVMIFGVLSKAESQERHRVERVKVFVGEEGMESLINDWLKNSPQIEITHVTQSVKSNHGTIVIVWYK